MDKLNTNCSLLMRVVVAVVSAMGKLASAAVDAPGEIRMDFRSSVEV
jgi:hypothetical protein